MIVLGLTGSFGSGCTYIAEEFIIQRGYEYISLAECLRISYKEETGSECNLTRQEMQDYGTWTRENKGSDYLANKVIELIQASGKDKWVIDSIRNPNEALALRNEFGEFYLFALRAEFDIRWNRVQEKYDKDKRIFETDDKRDSDEKLPHGQRVRDCYEIADIIIANNTNCHKGNADYSLLETKVSQSIQLIQGELEFVPMEQEAIMAIAYATSIRSSCLQRKVGAVIVDEKGNIFSSGYNEVPTDQRPCKAEYNICYRKFLKAEFAKSMSKIIQNDVIEKRVNNAFQEKFKILDYCRSLHAEENAIINIARFGGSGAIKNATLYTTTYPCNLCANKIVQIGITKIVYMEPYPMEGAKKILTSNNVTQVPFEGISFNGYFKFKGEG